MHGYFDHFSWKQAVFVGRREEFKVEAQREIGNKGNWALTQS